MSVIFGILNFTNAPIASHSLSQMEESMTHLSADKSGIWTKKSIGLGNLLRYNTPESLYEKLPLRDELSGCVLVWGGRLDNRAELSQALNIPSAQAKSLPDSRLALTAYLKWGISCPDHLLGDWAFALWDAKQHKLFVARDHYGTTGLYYYYDHCRFVFASSLKGILALPEIPRHLNPFSLGGMGFRNYASTPYKNIHRLTPAQALTITIESPQPRIWHYWHPKNATTIRLRSDQDYIDAFMETYREAISCRLRSNYPIGIALSGGLDSGSISTLASHELTQRGQDLFAFSSIPTYETESTTPSGRCADERSYTEATCQFGNNIQLTYIKNESITPIEALRQGIETFELPHAGANLIWGLELYKAAREKNIGTMLDGWGGNFTISWAGNRNKYLMSLIRSQDWRTFIHEFNKWQSVNQSSFFRTMKSQVFLPFIPPIWVEHLRDFRSNRHRSVFNPLALQDMKKKYKGITIDTEAVNSLNPGLHSFFRNGKTSFAFEMGAAFGMEARQPAMDKRLIEFCLGIPQNQHTRDGQDRLLIRRAMKGLMPDKVLWYKQRGIQSADIGSRIRVHRDEIGVTLEELRASNMAQYYLDLPYMTELFKGINDSLDLTTLSSASKLFKGLTIGLFLERFENART